MASPHVSRALLDDLNVLKAVFKSLAMLSTAVEQTADGVIITDNRGVIEYVNPAFEGTTGYAASEALGKTPRILKSGLHDEQFYKELWSQVLSGKPFRATIVNRKKSGELYWAEQTISPIKNERQELTHFVSILKDVTELRKKQEQDFHMQFARRVQQRFYGPTISVPGFDIAGAAHPTALTGGDYFDFIPQPDGSVYVAIGDVSGHGFDAALLMATARAYTRASIRFEANPAAVIDSVNQALTPDLAGDQFFTLLLIRLDPQGTSLQYASAGHVPGYVLSASGEVRVVLDATSPPCGLFSANERAATGLIPLLPGETVLLMTDGVTEATDPDSREFGAERVLEAARAHHGKSAQQLVEAILESTRAFAGVQPQSDDTTLVVCKMGPRTSAGARAGAAVEQAQGPGHE